MAKPTEKPLAGTVLDEDVVISLAEMTRSCGVEAEVIMEMIEYGIVEPSRDKAGSWQFSGTSLRRVTTVARLQRDLGVNLAGAALALDLIDQVQALQRRLQAR